MKSSMSDEGKPESISFIDLAAQYDRISDELNTRVSKVFQHGRYIMGPEVEELENNLSDFVEIPFCITCASGTDALLLPLLAWGIGPGTAVFTTAFTFVATAEVISLLGAIPVFVDIDPVTYNMDPADLKSKIEKVISDGQLVPRAIIPVDLYGLPADYCEIERIAEKYDLKILEDAAQSFGADYLGQKAGSFGHAAATSFFPAKPLGCYGDGGAIFTFDENLAQTLRSIRVHGQGSHKYENVRIGVNSRMDTLQAAILLEKLKIFPEEILARNRIAQRYTDHIESSGLGAMIKVPFVPNGSTSGWAQYTVRVENRDLVQARLAEKGIPTMVYYPLPLHLQKAFADLGGVSGDLPFSEAAANEVMSLPMYPYLSDRQIDRICSALKEVFE